MEDRVVKISVLMTAFNREKYIAEAIESILLQSYSNFELIVVDDCSTDNTVTIAQNYQNHDSRIFVNQNLINLGDYPNRNKAASYAKGDLIIYVDSDDSILPNALEYIVKSFDSNPSALHSSLYYGKDISAPILMDSKIAIKNHYFLNNALAGGPGSRVFKRSFFEQLNGYPIKYGPANDSYFNIISVIESPILFLPYDYLNYRIHDQQEQNNHFAYLYNGYNYLNDLLFNPKLPLTNTEKEKLYLGNKRRFILNLLKYYFKNKSIQYSIRAIKYAQFTFKDLFYSLGFSSLFTRFN
jgi:glycosyltransferase involved in cell wall biosynthesis